MSKLHGWLILIAISPLGQPVVAAAEKPNLVFIIADDCTFRDIGCYGGQAHTPHLDRFASQGMQFSACFQAAPMCSPTRHNIYTGLYPVRSGAYPNHTQAYNDVLSIVHYLQPLGYRVALTGKTHIAPKTVFPFEYLKANGNNPSAVEMDRLLRESRETQTPFCLFACSNEPHSPWDKGDASRYPADSVVLPPYIVDTPVVREDFRNYLAEITYFDSQVGEILELLDQHRLSDNTLVMIVSEQGNAFPFAKWTCYDSGLQSAMLVRWPGRVEVNSKTDAMVEYVDIAPTLVDAAGGEPNPDLDGRSFLRVLTGESEEHKSEVYGIMTTRGIINGSAAYAIRSVRTSQFKLIHNLNSNSKFTNACTSSAAFQSMEAKAEAGDATARKLVDAYYYRPEFELYDVLSDPLELTNIAHDPQNGKILADLQLRLQGWMQRQGDAGVATELSALERQGKGKKRNQAK
ncbi:sulfatase family protein [Aureliella helgolandensis]|uniref:Choline-sulfatase n=1 Tax=Aureliella helgolandensis TaxID=2527968 RepID=A0A518G972_9BACT|nr:sulfatase [Aureliella helgolandensis]QDV25120.1 Choline-sulfatase [Aureliella helgolandensis]